MNGVNALAQRFTNHCPRVSTSLPFVSMLLIVQKAQDKETRQWLEQTEVNTYFIHIIYGDILFEIVSIIYFVSLALDP